MSLPALTATKTDPDEVERRSLAPRLAGAPEPAVAPDHPGRWARWVRKGPGLAFTLVFHLAAAAAFVPLWRSMVRDLSAPEAIPVELVSSVPGEVAAPAPEQPKPQPKQPEATKPEEAKAPPPPPPPPDALRQALPMPEAPPDPPPEPSQPPGPKPEDGEAPGLREPPPEPKAAETQSERNEPANTAPVTPEPPAHASPALAPPAPEVMAAPGGETAVPAPAPEPDKTADAKPAGADPAAASASLAAALPMSSIGMPTTFRRAMVSGQGSSDSQKYKGVIYGALGRATAAMAEEARRRHLRGQVAILIILSPNGVIERASVVQSSGSSQTDALALEMVRRAAPFPAPPPGVSRSVAPVISFGDE